MTLTLRLPGPADEADCRRLHRELAADGFAFLMVDGTWAEICLAARKEHEGIDIAPDRVPGSWLVADLTARGVDRVLVTCDDSNAASADVIEKCGGVLEGIRIGRTGEPKRRYWIDAA